MIATFIALLGIPSGITGLDSVTLERGGVGDASFRYWAVEDTFIDREAPDENYGRDSLLSVGLGKTALLRFGDLNRMVPAGKRVKNARLFLRIEIGKTPAFAGIGRMLVPWGEGPGKRGFMRRPVDPKAKPMGPTWSATWKHRRAGEGAIGWQQPGGTGASDQATIAGATMAVDGDWIVIDGLAAAVQAMVDRPYDNFGFGIRFDSSLDLASSDALQGRPRLELELEDVPRRTGPDLSVTGISWNWTDPAQWPPNGHEVIWTATVTNVGDASSEGFNSRWSVRERPHTDQMIAKSLAPGESIRIEAKVPWRSNADPRTAPIALRIDTPSTDADPRNDGLSVDTLGLSVSVTLPPAALEESRKQGFACVEDYVQDRFRFWNETLLPQSRFSFAPEGAKQRFRLHALGSGGQIETSLDSAALSDLRKAMVRLSRSAGLPDWATLTHPAGTEPLVVDGVQVWRGTSDLFPGLLGGGDTRDEGTFLPTLSMLYEPWVDSLIDAQPMPSTDLYSGADVAILNALIGRLGEARRDYAVLFPRTPLVRVQDAGGRPLVGMTLDFFPVSQGKVQPVAFTAKTNNQGVAGLSVNGRSPFADLDATWSGGLYLVRTSAHGVTEWGWLKAWQVVEETARGSALLNLRFALPASPIEPATNLTLNKIVTDMPGSLPAKLAPLVDGATDTVAEIGLAKDEWLEIDLGRDRPLGEVRLVLPQGTAPWPKFDIYVYATGQRASEARLWTQERDSSWTIANRRDFEAVDKGLPSVAYRGPLTRARFIRLVVREASGPARIAEIRAAPLTFDIDR